MSEPLIGIVIPALKDYPEVLIKILKEQTYPNISINVVCGVSPNGKARNEGVKRTDKNVEYYLFIDDDAIPGHRDMIKNMVTPFLEDKTIGVVGCSQFIPENSNWFQRQIAKQIPRVEFPLVDRLTESNPSTSSREAAKMTTTCVIVKREAYEKVVGFNEQLTRGVDTEFFFRVRKAGYRFVITPYTWNYHPAPSTPVKLVKKYFWYGVGASQESRLNPERRIYIYLKTPLHALIYFCLRTLIIPLHTFISMNFKFKFQPLHALASYVGAIGYIWGWYNFSNVVAVDSDREVDCLFARGQLGLALGKTHLDHLVNKINIIKQIRIADEISSILKNGSRILDWGCGFGQLAFLLKKRGLDVIAYDIGKYSKNQVLSPEPIFPEIPIIWGEDDTVLPFNNGEFDAVISCGVLEHALDYKKSLKEISRILRKDGLIIIYMLPSIYSPLEWFADFKKISCHPVKFNTDSIRLLFRSAGFEMITIRKYGLMPHNLKGFPQYIRKVYHGLSEKILNFDLFCSRIPILNFTCRYLEIIAKNKLG